MSTTWVFVGLLAGRELAIALLSHNRLVKDVLKIVLKDGGKLLTGLVVSVILAFMLRPDIYFSKDEPGAVVIRENAEVILTSVDEILEITGSFDTQEPDPSPSLDSLVKAIQVVEETAEILYIAVDEKRTSDALVVAANRVLIPAVETVRTNARAMGMDAPEMEEASQSILNSVEALDGALNSLLESVEPAETPAEDKAEGMEPESAANP
jgi:tetrahydromethanopterin S-methyltransferase subunit B